MFILIDTVYTLAIHVIKLSMKKQIGNISFDNLSTKNRLVFQKLEKVLCSVVCFLLVCIDQSTILSAGSVCVEKM